MKTLSVNPFHLKPVIKRALHRPKEVVIPKEYYAVCNEGGIVYDRLLSMTGSMDYMKTNYGINFGFGGADDKYLFVICSKGKNSAVSEDITDLDTTADIARKIYEAASKIL